MTKRQIRAEYRRWRRANGNAKPNRALIRMKWEDGDNTDKGWQEDTVAIDGRAYDSVLPSDDTDILWYCLSLEGLCDLVQPHNGSDFVLLEVVGFYKHTENNKKS